MRNKRSSGSVRSNSNKQEESSDASSSANTASQSASSSSLSGKRAADVLANYKSNLEPGSAGSSYGKNNSSGSTLLSEIREGAERLATELDHFLSTSENHSSNKKDGPPLSDEAIADLQLATARKLRQVSNLLQYSIRVCICIYNSRTRIGQ
jgi:hypothetical protein